MRCALHAMFIALCLLALADGVAAQGSDTLPPPMSIRVTGDASLSAAPDQAEIDVGVITRGDTAGRAADDNTRAAARVIADLKKQLGAAGTIETIGYSVEPEYRHPREGTEPQVSGYVARNVIRVTSANLDLVGALVDTAVAAVANRVQRIRFVLKNQEAVYAEALRQAASRARAEADALASALGLRVVRVLSAAEESGFVRPFVDTRGTAALAIESTPVQPGAVDVDARIVLTVEVSGR